MTADAPWLREVCSEMAKIVIVKVEYEDTPHKIQATNVKEEHGKLQLFDGDKKVGEFRLSSVEHWSFSEEEKF